MDFRNPNVLHVCYEIDMANYDYKTQESEDFYIKRQSKLSDLTYANAYQTWEKYQDGSEYIVADFYGDGGRNRFYIRGNGEIVLSRHHATKEALEVAKKLGMAIFD